MIFTTVLQWSIFDCVKDDLDDQNLLLATVFKQIKKTVIYLAPSSTNTQNL
jgi:hypothetical protein